MLYWIFIWSLMWNIGLLTAHTVTYDINTQMSGFENCCFSFAGIF